MNATDRPTIRYWFALLTAMAVLLSASLNFLGDSPWPKALQLLGFIMTISVVCHAVFAYSFLSYRTRMFIGTAVAIAAWLILTNTQTVSFPWSNHDSFALPEFSTIALTFFAYYLADRTVWNSISSPKTKGTENAGTTPKSQAAGTS